MPWETVQSPRRWPALEVGVAQVKNGADQQQEKAQPHSPLGT